MCVCVCVCVQEPCQVGRFAGKIVKIRVRFGLRASGFALRVRLAWGNTGRLLGVCQWGERGIKKAGLTA